MPVGGGVEGRKLVQGGGRVFIAGAYRGEAVRFHIGTRDRNMGAEVVATSGRTPVNGRARVRASASAWRPRRTA
jgi:hypothetical protein